MEGEHRRQKERGEGEEEQEEVRDAESMCRGNL